MSTIMVDCLVCLSSLSIVSVVSDFHDLWILKWTLLNRSTMRLSGTREKERLEKKLDKHLTLFI